MSTILTIMTVLSMLMQCGGTATQGSFVLVNLNEESNKKYFSICGEYTYFQVYMPYPCLDLNIEVHPSSGEPDVYVSRANLDQDPYPTKSKMTWAAYADGQYKLSISHWDPESAPGWYYIGVFDDCTSQSQTASYTIKAYTSEDDADDIYQHKQLSHNKLLLANDYVYYRFCVPECADVKVTLQNCLSYETCGESYSLPELLVTRTDRVPTIFSYSYKLASSVRRSIEVNHTDPAGRDHNGYLTGSYYVGVFGWCTPDNFVVNWATDGPCSYAARTLYNVTVQLSPLPSSSCDAKSLIYAKPPPMKKITSGQIIKGVVPVNEYIYYAIDVLDPCETLNIWIGDSATPNYSVPELAVGKWPNVVPTMDNLEWTSYQWTSQNLTISAWDPDFDGGYVCGPHKNATCTYIIGVIGYASLDSIQNVNFTMIATLTPQHKIFGVPQTHQSIAPKGLNQYAFCVRSQSDVVAELVSWSSSMASQCPDSYSSLEMVVSLTNPLATTTDLVWRLGHDQHETNAIYLFENDADFRLGSYYLNVLGYCDTCAAGKSCSPCSNVNNTRYSVVVSNNILFNSTADRQTYLGSCPATANVVSVSTSSSSSSSSGGLSDGAKAGIAIAVIIIFISICLGLVIIFYWKRPYSNPNINSKTGDDSDHEMAHIASTPIQM